MPRLYYYPDLRQLALEDTFVIDPPGEYFLYNNYHPLLLGMILERATGVPVAEYLEQKIWRTIGTEYSRDRGAWMNVGSRKWKVVSMPGRSTLPNLDACI